MKKLRVISLIDIGFMASAIAQAETHTASPGYAHISLQKEKALNGATLGYRYEFNDDWGVLGDFTFTKGDRKETDGFVNPSSCTLHSHDRALHLLSEFARC